MDGSRSSSGGGSTNPTQNRKRNRHAYFQNREREYRHTNLIDADMCHIFDHLSFCFFDSATSTSLLCVFLFSFCCLFCCRMAWQVFHLLIGSANIGFLAYFTSSPFAASHEWVCWSHGCGLFLMAFPQILLLAAFLLLLSFWVDFCHQYWDNDDSDEEKGICECLLEREASQTRCCPFLMCSTDVRRRQKIVILVTSVAFLLIISLATMIRMGKGKNYIDPLLAYKIYLKSISAVGSHIGRSVGWLWLKVWQLYLSYVFPPVLF